MYFYLLMFFLFVINILILKSILGKLKIENNSYINAFIVSLHQFISYLISIFVVLIGSMAVYGLKGTPNTTEQLINQLLIFVLPFIVFCLICKRIYKTSFLKNIFIFMILNTITISLYYVVVSIIFKNITLEY